MFSFLLHKSRFLLLIAAFMSVVAGVFSVLLVTQINTALTATTAERLSLAYMFAGTAVLTMLARIVTLVLFERLAQQAHADLRRFISERVMQADYRHLERVGGARVYSALSEHTSNVADFFASLPVILTNAIVVIGCLVYMAMLSWTVFLLAVVTIGLGSIGYHLAHLRAIGHLNDASNEQNSLFGHFRALTEGAKELRLNHKKRSVFAHLVLNQSIEAVRKARSLGMSIFLVSASWGNFLIYAFIGIVIFVLTGDNSQSVRVMTGFALMLIYMMTPLEALLLNIPRANLAKVSAASIDEITSDMPPSSPSVQENGWSTLQKLELRHVKHRYYHEQSDDFFAMGPISLDFSPGEVTFLVGGNGSGKTTLAKLLVGLYPAEEGQLLFNGQVVTEHNRGQYQQIFSAIFSDFYLFDRLLETATPDLDEKGNRLIEKLHLQHKVQVKDGAFTTRALSQGQRKRLALVVAYLEDRPFFVFDEWAADQDPLFKDVFYYQVLSELRAMGKAVLVISHDDRYFHLADKIIRMENGKLVDLSSSDSLTTSVAPKAFLVESL